MYRTKMRENLINFEKKYIELLRTKRPEYFNSEGQPIEGYIAQCATTGNIYKENQDIFDNWSIKYKNEKQIIPMSPLLSLIGASSSNIFL